MLKKFLILIIIYFTFLPFSIFAQIQETDVILNLNPKEPKANQNITAKISSFVMNTKEAYYVWRINEETKLTGIGKDTFSFTLGEINSFTELSVDITTKEGNNVKKSINLASSDIDLIWEATNSYVPPFYKGKTLFSREGEVKVVAIPSIYNQGIKINPNNLSYSWTKDNNPQLKDSGFGKTSFSYKNSFLHQFNRIDVSVSDLNKQSTVSATLNIVPQNPKISFYEIDDNGINLNKPILNNTYIPKEGKDIALVPYFFSPKNLNASNLDIKWYINNKQVPNTTKKNILSVIPEADQTGNANIKVIISNLNTLFQELQRSITVNF